MGKATWLLKFPGICIMPQKYLTRFDAVLSKHPTLAFSQESKSLFCTSVSLFLFCIGFIKGETDHQLRLDA